MLKSPLATTLETVSAELPMSVMVKVCAVLDDPTGCAENWKAPGISPDAAASVGEICSAKGLEYQAFATELLMGWAALKTGSEIGAPAAQ